MADKYNMGAICSKAWDLVLRRGKNNRQLGLGGIVDFTSRRAELTIYRFLGIGSYAEG